MPYPYNYTKLWEPIQINGMKLRNRISLSPMGTYTPRLDGTDTEEGMRYYEERAKGGVGLIMTGAMFVNKQLAQGSPGIAVWDYHSIPSTTVLTERCHRWGAKVCTSACSSAPISCASSITSTVLPIRLGSTSPCSIISAAFPTTFFTSSKLPINPSKSKQ